MNDLVGFYLAMPLLLTTLVRLVKLWLVQVETKIQMNIMIWSKTWLTQLKPSQSPPSHECFIAVSLTIIMS